jgi:ABC-type multidrug transport system ATPase subunit
MSTHDIFRAKQVVDRLGIMNNGVLVAELTREELEHEDLEKVYVSFMAGYMDDVNSPDAGTPFGDRAAG